MRNAYHLPAEGICESTCSERGTTMTFYWCSPLPNDGTDAIEPYAVVPATADWPFPHEIAEVEYGMFPNDPKQTVLPTALHAANRPSGLLRTEKQLLQPLIGRQILAVFLRNLKQQPNYIEAACSISPYELLLLRSIARDYVAEAVLEASRQGR